MSEHRPLFPIFLDLAGRPCVVVGGGPVAARKVAALLEAGAEVTVVAPALSPEMASLVEQGAVRHLPRAYRPGDLAGSLLAFAATDDAEVNAAVWAEAGEQGIPLNAVDDPPHCSFIVPSRVERGPIAIAISTRGASPALAAELRRLIEQAVPPAYGELAALLGELRPAVKAALPPADRAAAWQRVLDGTVLDLLAQGRPGEARALARKLLGLPGKDQSVTIGTRGSRLALAQAEWVAARLQELGVTARLEVIRTHGDGGRDPLCTADPDLFVREIELALAAGRIDLAVHSLKDLPTAERPGLRLAAVPRRADPSDSIVTRTGEPWLTLPPGSRVGTSSPRRRAQLQAMRPDLAFVPVRGNVDTRLRKLAAGEMDALVVASAALQRLGLPDVPAERLPYEVSLPAPGQGALALQVRADDEATAALVARLDDSPTHHAVVAERAFLVRLGGGCAAPVSALGEVAADQLRLQGSVSDPEGRRTLRDEMSGPAPEAEKLGCALAERLLAAGAAALLGEARC